MNKRGQIWIYKKMDKMQSKDRIIIFKEEYKQ